VVVKIYGIISLLFLAVACNTTEPPNGEKPTLTLKLEDASCTEAWITLSATNLTAEGGQATLILKQNDEVRDTINLSSTDTLLYIDSLLPNTNYQYQASSIQNPATSNELTVTTMDTTSHNFTFETFTFGGSAGSSTLYDVAIINENNIWAVGEIYVAGTSQNGYTKYNAVHWDGSQWELKRILYDGNFWVIRTIFAFNENDVWFSAFVRFNGKNFIELPIPDILMGWSPNKIWGTSSNDLYIVGNNGNIARYNGSRWNRIESGTTTNIQDIWGIDNLILCAVSNVASAGDRKIIKIKNNQVSNFLWDTGRRVQSIWFNSSNAIYTCGGGVFLLKDGINWNEVTEIPLYYTESIRGDGLNDIIVVGDFGLLAHFNGTSWKVYDNPVADIYYSCAVRENLVVAVGMKGNSGFIVVANK
jgi:hypothetical protein